MLLRPGRVALTRGLARLAFANLGHRCARTFAAIAGVAGPVCLALVAMGLAEGTLRGIAGRLTSVGADVFVQPPGSSVLLGSGSARMPQGDRRRLDALASVESVAPGLLHSVSQLHGRSAALNLWAIDPSSFAAVSGGFDVLQGRGLDHPMEVLVDEALARDFALEPGARIELLGSAFRVAGITRAGMGARLYARLQDLQALAAAEGQVSFFLVRRKPDVTVDAMEGEIRRAMPGFTIPSVAVVSQALREGAIGLRELERALTMVVSVLSAAIVFLTAQAAILERTRQIGVLRALGLGRADTLRLVLVESLTLCLGGALAGTVLASLVAAIVPQVFPSLAVRLEPATGAALVGFVCLGGLLGALAPAVRAARLDPAVALDTP